MPGAPGENSLMSKAFVKIVVRVVERPVQTKPQNGQSYQPPKKAVFKAIATCELNGKQYSRTATHESEEETRRQAFSKLATLVAKLGGVPGEGPGVVSE